MEPRRVSGMIDLIGNIAHSVISDKCRNTAVETGQYLRAY
jgi:hypothetical protein